jgi:hypothetical protein
MILFRPVRRFLHEAMEEVRQFADERHLIETIKKENADIYDVRIEYQAYDKRIDWNTYIISVLRLYQPGPAAFGYITHKG